jgi:hypothetical protein
VSIVLEYRVTALILFGNKINIYVEPSTIFTQTYILFLNAQKVLYVYYISERRN